jgi:hypothetical protein
VFSIVCVLFYFILNFDLKKKLISKIKEEMAVDISKVFRANIKAIRINQSDGSTVDALNEELLLKKNKNKTPINQQLQRSQSTMKEAKLIVSMNRNVS